MPFVNAKCPNCGGTLQVDNMKKVAVCPFCKEECTFEDAVNNFVTNYTTNVENLHAEVVNINEGNSVDAKINAADTFMILGDYSSAKKIYVELTEDHPYDYHGWWGVIRAKTADFQKTLVISSELSEIQKYYHNARSLCENPEPISAAFSSYLAKTKEAVHQEKNNLKSQIALAEKEKAEIERHKTADTESIDSQIEFCNRKIKWIETLTKFRFRIALTLIAFISACIIEIGIGNTMKEAMETTVFLVPIGFLVGWGVDFIRIDVNRSKSEKDERRGALLREKTELQSRKNEFDRSINRLNSRIESLKETLNSYPDF